MTAGKNAKVKASGLTGAAASPFGPGTPGRPGEPCKKQEKDRKTHESTVSALAARSNCPAVIDWRTGGPCGPTAPRDPVGPT